MKRCRSATSLSMARRLPRIRCDNNTARNQQLGRAKTTKPPFGGLRVCQFSSQDWKILERAKGFEPSTPTLARSCSTPELHPHQKWTAPSAAGRHLCQTPRGNATEKGGLFRLPARFKLMFGNYFKRFRNRNRHFRRHFRTGHGK